MITSWVNLLRIYTKLLSKIDMHPLLQKLPIDTKEAMFLRHGKMCVSLSFLVRAVFGSSAWFVELVISLFGFFTGSRNTNLLFFKQAKSSVRYCPAVPESTTAALSECIILIVIEVDKNLGVTSLLTVTPNFISSHFSAHHAVQFLLYSLPPFMCRSTPLFLAT